MDETSHQIERHIEQTRSDLDENLHELGDKIKKTVDWRAQFDARPGTMLCLAFAGGVVLSTLFSPGPRTVSASDLDGSEHGSQTGTASVPSSALTKKPSETRQNVEAFAGALIGVAANRASKFIDSLVPGFEDELRNTRASKSAASSSSDCLGASHAPFRSSAADAD